MLCDNNKIQAAGSALLKIAIVLLRRKLNHLDWNDRVQILMPYHDEISIQAKPDYADDAKYLLETAMTDAAKIAGYPLLGATAKIGTSWGNTH